MRQYLLVAVIICVVCSAACAKKEKAAPSSLHTDGVIAEKSQADSEQAVTDNETSDVSQDLSVQQWFSQKGGFEQERLIEYTIELDYESRNFEKSRDLLLELIKRYGFLRQSSLSNTDSPYLVTHFSVKSESLFTVLTSLNSIGKITTETINANDRTLENYYNLIRQRREQLRSTCRLNALVNVDAGNKNYELREQYLSQSEDALDENEYQMKQLDDAVSWVKISVTIRQKAQSVFEIPDYRDAFITMIEMFLRLLYVFIVILPYLSCAIVVILFRKPISLFLSKLTGRKKL